MVHIADVLARRHVPSAGLFLSLTRRCPLSCAHCSTNSTIASEQHPAAPFLRLVDSFTDAAHPEFVFMTGGEALLRLSTVRAIAGTARRTGTRTVLITGLYFARARGAVPEPLAEVLRTIDHVVISHDRYHEPEVPRAHALDVAACLLDMGIDVSFQLVADAPDDPCVAESVAAIRARFGERIAALVAPLGAVGRGAALFEGPTTPVSGPVYAAPCVMAAWPTVAYDGTVVACCSQDVVDGPAPPHLVLGHAARDDWATIAERCRSRASLRAIRVFGPQELTRRYEPGCASGGYCSTCVRIGERPVVSQGAEKLAATDAFAVIEALVQRTLDDAGPQSFARTYGVPEYADMLTLGRPAPEPIASGAAEAGAR
jgi:hypothetical protein